MSILAACPGVSSPGRHFESGQGPEDEVSWLIYIIYFKECHDVTKLIPAYPIKDVKATGHVIRVTSTISLLQCADKCLRRALCSSFNFQNTDKKCELLRDVKGKVHSQGNDFYEFSRPRFKEVCHLGLQS